MTVCNYFRSAISAAVLICTAAQYIHEPGRYLAKVFCSERLAYHHHGWLPADHFQGVDYFSEAYCRVKDADTELLVKGTIDALQQSARS